MNQTTFAGRVMAARLAAGLTREDLSETLDFANTAQVSRWEHGTSGRPRDIEVTERLAAALGTRPAWLLYGVEEPELFDASGYAEATVDDAESLDTEHESPIKQRAREMGAIE